jgi:hypothetical protein
VPDAATIWDIWGTGPNDAYLAGTRASATAQGSANGLLYHFDGDQWDVTTYPGGSLRAGWSSSTDDVWVAAYDAPLQHWDGNTWSSLGGANELLFAMWGTSGADVWTAGANGRVLHFDGSAWNEVPSETDQYLWTIWGSASDDVWIAGAAGALLHWNGATFTRGVQQ